MAQLTFSQIEELWIRNGGTPGWAPLMAGIALAESGGNTTAFNTNPSTFDESVGLWQINYFGNLYGARAPQFGTPQALRNTPNAQARAAISLSTNGKNLTPWRTDPTWDAWQAAGRPYQPDAQTVAKWVSAHLTAAPVSVTSTVTNAKHAGYPAPSSGQRFAFPGERTYSIVTPSVIPGISATPPTTPSFGLTPIGDIGTSLRFATTWGGWALMTVVVFVIGLAILSLGLIMLLMILFGPVTEKAVGLVGPAKFARVLSPAKRARRIENRTRLATAKARRATRNEATARYRAAGGDAGIRRSAEANRRVAASRRRDSGIPAAGQRARRRVADTPPF